MLRIALILIVVLGATAAAPAQDISPQEARAIARDAYVWGFPIVDNYRVQYAYFVDKTDPEYKGSWNEVHNTARVYTPEDKAIQTPNSDTPYSMAGVDLRAEPMVLSVPDVEPGRYYSAQFIDMYTYNFAYVGSRATGNGAGSYLIAGPGWTGETPAGIKEVFRAETQFVFIIFRTQLFAPDDLENVKKVQAGYKLEPLSAFLGKTPLAAPPVDFLKPLSAQDERTSPEFFNVLNFALQFIPVNPVETELRARFAKLGIEPGKTFDAKTLSSEIQKAVSDGIADAWVTDKDVEEQMMAGKVTSGDLFGNRQTLGDKYAYRMHAAVAGIYGNSKEEAVYPPYLTDSTGTPLEGKNRYTLRFAADGLPPVDAFWSVTMYEMPSSLLYANPLNRYLINSAMLPNLVKDGDGGVTIYVQSESPGADKEANWLPAPEGHFVMAMRLYWPKPEVLDGQWKAPPLHKTE